MAVLDEADEMLDMGFIEDIEAILAQAPSERQTALFSATMPPEMVRLSKRFMREPVRVTIKAETATVPEVRQVYYEVGRDKVDALSRILDFEQPTSAIVFTRTRVGAQEVADALESRGYAPEPLHGDMSQAQREAVMRRFRDGRTETLVATDVAARGLDIEHVSHVINCDIPESPDSYVHRVGRTARAGRRGHHPGQPARAAPTELHSARHRHDHPAPPSPVADRGGGSSPRALLPDGPRGGGARRV
ncbi:MAG: DEAD/DEAH box helicase [Ardenticatenaceae bacterium]|nr:DEAD/DEAH box helicase [Ardenticatenaceae bacterium]